MEARACEDTAEGRREKGKGKSSQEQAGEDVALALIFILCAFLAAVAPFLALLVHFQVCCSTKTTPSRHASRRSDSGIPVRDSARFVCTDCIVSIESMGKFEIEMKV